MPEWRASDRVIAQCNSAALSRGPNKVVMWSFPIIKDGLIYVVDIRNGYTGPRADEVDPIRFLEGNSNLGDALRIAKSAE